MYISTNSKANIAPFPSQ